MNDDMFKGAWTQMRGKIKEKWGKLTDDEIDQAEGRMEQLAGRIQERYGMAKADAQRELEDWWRSESRGV